MAARSLSSSRATSALVFQSLEFHPVTRKGQVWLRAGELAQALGYADDKSVHRIFGRHLDEFTPSMTGVVKLTTPCGTQDTRVFSLRGAHLVAMFARTPVAKDFRRWVLDVLDAQTTAPPSLNPDELITVNDWVARMARAIEQPNGYPVELFAALVDAVNRKLARRQTRRTSQALAVLADQLKAQSQAVALMASGSSMPGLPPI